MYNLNLDEDEKTALQNLLKDMRWYGLMDSLCPYYKTEEKTDKATHAILRLSEKLSQL